ncbi:MAG: GNAT family N-acetyltransferase [Pseudomonadota bacterium]
MIETQRLRLRQWRRADDGPFAQLNADPEVMRYFPTTLSRADSDTMAARIRARIAQRGWGFWAVERLSDNAMLGFVGLECPRPEVPISPCVEIGWRLARAHWGHGYATEAAKAALHFAFEHLLLSEVVAFTVPENQRSQAVMMRLAMVRQPTLFELPSVPPGHPMRKQCWYRIAVPQTLRRGTPVDYGAGAST